MVLKPVMIDGVEYKVVENLGFQNGLYGKEIETPTGLRIVSSPCAGGPYKFHQPLILPGGRAIGQ